MRRAALLAALVASVALVVAGCGGDDEPETSQTTEWAQDFCTTVNEWTDALGAIGDDLEDPSALSVDAIRDAADEAEGATDDFVEALRDLGRPETESGDQVESSIEGLADTLEQERDDVEQAIDDMSDLTDVPGAITAIGTSLSAMGGALQQTLDAIEAADAQNELETAFDEAEACQDLGD